MGHRIHRASAALAGLGVAAMLGLASAPGWAQTASAEAAKQLTVERIYGEPGLGGKLAKGIEWSPDGKLLSYLQPVGEGRKAARELWTIDVATGARRKQMDAEKLRSLLPVETEPPTQTTGLGRLEPKRYLWAPSSDALLFISKSALTWFDMKTQTARPLVSGDQPIKNPKVSPDGRWVSFLRDYNLWAVNVVTGQQKALTEGGSEELRNGQLDWVYPEELEIYTAYWWSPDSAHIAYLQMDERSVTDYPLINFLSYTSEIKYERYPKAGGPNPIVRLGVVPAGGGKTRWMGTGSDTNVYLARVAWMPDGKRLAIERLNRAQTRLDLLLADVSTGRSQVLLTETDKDWLNLSHDLYFLDDGEHFLWSSERSGFRHVYLYNTAGKLLRPLTKGGWMVTDLSGVDETQGLVYFVSTEKNPIERQLYRVSLEGGEPQRLTLAEGTHEIDMAPGATAYVDTYSNVMTPPRQDLYRADGGRLAVINENRVAELDGYHLSPVAFFTVPGADGTPLNAMMIKPPNFDSSRKYPVLIYVYGGPGSQAVLNSWTETSGPRFLWHQMMAQKGYIIFALDNRGSTGRGHAFETPVYHHFAKVELADQLAGVHFLRSLPYVDGSRLGIWGWSYGGHMTLQAMFNAPEVFKAGVSVAPVADWRQYDTIYTERYMGTPQENLGGYTDSSPVTHAGNLKGKLLIAHGTGDDNVHFANSVELAEKLIEAGHYAEIMIFPGRGHPISDAAARIELFRRASQFLLDNL